MNFFLYLLHMNEHPLEYRLLCRGYNVVQTRLCMRKFSGNPNKAKNHFEIRLRDTIFFISPQ